MIEILLAQPGDHLVVQAVGDGSGRRRGRIDISGSADLLNARTSAIPPTLVYGVPSRSV